MSLNAATVYHNPNVGTTGVLISTGRHKVVTLVISNMASAARFLKIYDKATAAVVGTDTPIFTLGLQASMTLPVTINLCPPGENEELGGMQISNGLCIGASTAAADADTGAPSTGDVVANVFYK